MFDRVKVTVLVNNEAESPLLAEHGFALWVETGGTRILFDTGQGTALLHNAKVLGIPFERTDFLVLSHGHYDHTGALSEVLQSAQTARLVFASGISAKRYSLHPGKAPKQIGMPTSGQEAIQALPPTRAIEIANSFLITDGVGVTGPISRETDFEDEGGPFFLDEKGQDRDRIVDDQALWISTRRGVIVCLGCGHAGLINTVRTALRDSGAQRVHAVIGGFHLLNASAYRLQSTLDALHTLSPDCIVPCHCTGEQAVCRLTDQFPGRVIQPRAGFQCEYE